MHDELLEQLIVKLHGNDDKPAGRTKAVLVNKSNKSAWLIETIKPALHLQFIGGFQPCSRPRKIDLE